MQEKGRQLNRRSFLKWSAGAIGTVLAASASLPIFSSFYKVEAAANGQQHAGEAAVKLRPWCMVIDLKKCDGCIGLDQAPQCTIACINGHFAPKGEKWIEVYTAELPGGGTYFLPAPCFQCENAPCVNVCPVAATYHTDEGIVLIDHNRCIGCRMCMGACPYQRRFFNWATPELPPEAKDAEYSPIYPVPAVKGTVIKCFFCLHLLRQGKLPLCVLGCPRKVIYMGDLNQDVASNGVEVVKLSRFLSENNAFRYKDYLGTQPRLFYLPGHGQEFGRNALDLRPLKPIVWPWGGEGYNKRISLWPWEATP